MKQVRLKSASCVQDRYNEAQFMQVIFLCPKVYQDLLDETNVGIVIKGEFENVLIL